MRTLERRLERLETKADAAKAPALGPILFYTLGQPLPTVPADHVGPVFFLPHNGRDPAPGATR